MRVLPHPPTHSLLPHHPIILLGWGIEPSQDQGLLLPLMPDKAILWYICSWSHGSLHVNSLVGGLVPGSFRRGSLVGWYCCSSFGVANAYTVSPFSLHWGHRSHFDGWLQASTSVSVRLWQPLRRQPYQASVSKDFLASATVGIWWLHMEWIPQVGQSLDGVSFSLCSTFCPHISFRQEQFWVKILWRDGPIPQPGAMPNLWIWSLQVLSPLCWVFQLISSPLGPGSLLLFWHLGLADGYPSSASPIATHLFSISWPSVHLARLLPHLILPPTPLHVTFHYPTYAPEQATLPGPPSATIMSGR
jgi:hypothetical protein